MENLAKQVKILKIYASVLTLVVLVCIILILKGNNGHFKEITAERINIVEMNGKLRMAISNKERQDPGRYDNKPLPKRERPAGMIFFNDDGDECGGLVYDGDKRSASMTYSIDQYKSDQIMQLQYAQDNNPGKIQRSYGLKLWDRNDQFPETRLIAYDDSLKKLNDTNIYKAGMEKLIKSGVLTHERLFLGKNTDDEVGIFLRDVKGNPRLKIFVNKQNQPVIETLNAKGQITALNKIGS